MYIQALGLCAILLFADPVESGPALRIAVPGADWALVVESPEFEFGEVESNDDATRFWSFGDQDEPGTVLTVVVEKEDWAESAVECSEDARISRQAEELEQTHHGGVTVTRYVVRKYKEERIDQRHAHVHLYRGGYCIEAHLSVADANSKPASLIDRVVDSIRIVEWGR